MRRFLQILALGFALAVLGTLVGLAQHRAPSPEEALPAAAVSPPEHLPSTKAAPLELQHLPSTKADAGAGALLQREAAEQLREHREGTP
jgi:hypothetical protein